jgi:hypothetical protein
VVKLTGRGALENFKQALRLQNWIAAFRVARAGSEETAGEEKTVSNEKSVGEEKTVSGDESAPEDAGPVDILINLAAAAGRSVKPLVDLAERSGFNVEDVSLQRPTLNEVFFKYTGRRIRD